jgi:Hemerythrin HHE cation binding domain
MTGPLYRFFIEDHRRLEGLMNRAAADPAHIDRDAYEAFRRGLLKHISMEERILLPAAQRARGEPLPIAAKLRLDHSALATLLVPPASPAILAAVRAILADHDRIEESAGGLYDLCEQLLGGEMDDLMAKVRTAPDVGTIPHNKDPKVLDVVRRIAARAGYDLDDYSGK